MYFSKLGYQKALLLLCASIAMTSSFANFKGSYISAGSSIHTNSETADDERIDDYYTIDDHNKNRNKSDNVPLLTNKDVNKISSPYPRTRSTPNTNYDNTGSYTAMGNTWMSHKPVLNARETSGWGVRSLLGTTRHHSGVDLAAPSGTPIYATGPGIITKSGWGSGYGNYVEIDHGNGYMTRYAHASRLNVHVGDRVAAGQHIADVGCTGRCTGPHLHFEVVRNGQRQNPSTYLAMVP